MSNFKTIHHATKTKIYKHMFLDWFNNFLTVERYAEHYEMSMHRAKVIINKGRALHQDQFGLH